MIRMCEGIREYCKRQWFKGSAEVADEIDKVLCHLYGKASTNEWEEVIVSGRCFGCGFQRLTCGDLIGRFIDVYAVEFEKYMMS